MSYQRKADAHLRQAKRLAMTYVKDRPSVPEWMTEEQKQAWWLVQEAMDEHRKKMALSSLIDWAYDERERLKAMGME